MVRKLLVGEVDKVWQEKGVHPFPATLKKEINMKIQKFTIAGGNPTLLVWGCPQLQKNQYIKKYLGEVEQIGFVENSNGITILKMMGDELCINATLALASQLGSQNILLTSGINKLINIQNDQETTFLKIPLTFKRISNKVLFEGIGFICTDRSIIPTKKMLVTLADKNSKPAFGLIRYQKNKIRPYVYVKRTNSLVEETACGSGSIACSIVTGYSEIIHPTGQSILVRQRDDIFIVGAKVVKIGESYE